MPAPSFFLLRIPDRQQQGSVFRDNVSLEGEESQVDDYYTVLLEKDALGIGLLCNYYFAVRMHWEGGGPVGRTDKKPHGKVVAQPAMQA